MAYKIIAEECIGCGACESECPENAISATEDFVYVIDPAKCTEDATCVSVCPVDCIVLEGEEK
ncbi:4Fe-4S binding protein [Calorimonas adulescens]|jgi:4Fe-4S binding domain.|uniref:Ferredoxin n=1 Tax=Calorimonas adulescens TaxID=2606906 RepID=A0A5D8QFG1_9THEO|nr:4Fe-4S binding protein [Calorimonas adulescens]TZE82263.1 4Fe-4S dicluster domain-containing protein [Calorimonas adulescens]